MAQPAPIYDQEDEKPVTQPDLRSLEDESVGKEPKQGKLSSVSDKKSDKKSVSPEGLNEAETSGGTAASGSPTDTKDNSTVSEDENQIGNGYNDSDSGGSWRPGRLLGRLKGGKGNVKKNKAAKWLLLIFGISGLGLVILAAAILFMLNSLKIQNLATHVLEYNMVRTSRTLESSTEDVMAERLGMDATDGFLQGLKDSYGTFRSATWGQLDNFRPAKVMENLKSDGKLQFVYEETPRTGPLGKLIGGNKLDLTGIKIDGNEISLPELERGKFLTNIDNKVQFGAELSTNLEQALPEVPSFIRGKVAKEIQDSLGIKLSWWAKKGFDYQGKTEAEAFKKQQIDSYGETKQPPTESVDQQTTDAAKEASDKEDAAVKNGTAAETDLATIQAEARGTLTEVEQDSKNSVLQNIRNSMADSFAIDSIKTLSGYYQIALPVCLIYDGSTVKSQPTVDKKSTAAQKVFYGLETASDQQKSGDTTAPAVGAMNNKLGMINGSIPELRAAGKNVNTGSYVGQPDSPQTGGLGKSMSILNVFAGDNFITNTLNDSLDTVCPALLDLKVAAGVAIVNVAVGIFTGGASDGAEEGAAQGAGVAVSKIVSSDLLEGGISGFVKNLGKDVLRDTVAYGSLTILAKLMVLSHMSGNITGLETGPTYANQADMGGNLHANELQRQGLYGRPMTGQENTASKIADAQDLLHKHQQQSTFERYFAFNNPNSLVATTGYATLSTFGNFWNKGPVFISSLSKYASSLLTGRFLEFGLFGKKAAAMAGGTGNSAGEYGIAQWGWTEDEIATIKNNPTVYGVLVNAEEVAKPENANLYSNIQNDYGSCFKDSMGTLIANGSIVQNSDGEVSPTEGKCSPQNLGIKNPKYGDAVFRWRLSKLNGTMLDQLLSIQNPGSDNAGTTPTPAATSTIDMATIHESSSNVACATGTDDLGVQTGYYNGNPLPTRLCALPNLTSSGKESTPGSPYFIQGANGHAIVNSRVSGAFLALVTAAKAAGVNMNANSSFRTMANQQDLCNGNAGCRNGNYKDVAKPGTSNHQLGLAIDFRDTNSGDTKKCVGTHLLNGRCIAPGDPTWEWLNQNAVNFGIQQYVNESWHWSPDGH